MFNCIIVTPAGRRRYLEILYKYLNSQKTDFSEWHLWVNTTNQDDIDYMHNLASNNSWIKCINARWPINGNMSIGPFFEFTKDINTIYIRLDDDIVYLEPGFIYKMKTARESFRTPLFMYPNIINNAIISHLHRSLIDYPNATKYECMDDVAWKDPKFCEQIHRTFIESVKSSSLDKWRTTFTRHMPINFARVSINCISWFGSDMKNIIRTIRGDEEEYISNRAPRLHNRPNIIVNDPICVHFAFYTQREYIEEHTDILEQYRQLASAL